MISIKGLHKFFNKGRQNEIHVINDVTLDLPESGMVAVFGASGCGKTTLLNVIGGLDNYASGSVTIEDQSILKNTDEIRNKYIGYIFQNYNLNKDESCYDNVADALKLCGIDDPAVIEERVMAALSNVDMEKYAKRTPDTLSGGQQQRIAIARAIVKNPRIILADEPTGNLDENNTVMIMNLLKEISKDHLVVLVTHESNLVDFYCDKVIELSDGKIKSIRDNDSANGFNEKNKNDIYLGEFEKQKISNDKADIEYYGETPNAPIKLKIINKGGKIYVKVETEKAEIIDESSEIKLKDGVFEQREESSLSFGKIDMSKLPPINTNSFGKLFSFKSSLKSGYHANFKRRKKGLKVLKICMALFSASIVITSSIFGTAFQKISDAKNSYNHNVFYVFTNSEQASKKLNAAVGSEESGIDFIRLNNYYVDYESSVRFRLGNFETFSQTYSNDFSTSAVYLDTTVASGMELLEGKNSGLSKEEILITSTVADSILKQSIVGYISEYRDLIGLISTDFSIDGKNLRVAGIVDSDETAVFLSEYAMAKYVRNYFNPSATSPASRVNKVLSDGETILSIRNAKEDSKYPKINEKILIQGKEFKVVEIIKNYHGYGEWLLGNEIQKLEIDAYFEQIVKNEKTDIDSSSDEFYEMAESLKDEKYFEYYDYYYSEFDAFLKDRYFFDNEFELWLYADKGIEEMKYLYTDYDYSKAYLYKSKKGSYPSKTEYDLIADDLPGSESIDLNEYFKVYESEYYSKEYYGMNMYTSYLVSDNDYIALSKQLGESHESAIEGYYNGYIGENGEQIAYTLVHSVNPELTEMWLNNEFGSLSDEYYEIIKTPDEIFDIILKDNRENIIASFIAIVVMFAVMSVCMYFIMRSSLMNRIKEIGIYRAIGVSKKNLVFKFFIEAIVLSVLTVFVGYLLTSVFVYMSMGVTALISNMFFYPVWFALIVLVVILSVSVVCGILPILALLRKTPSEILAKYDI